MASSGFDLSAALSRYREFDKGRTPTSSSAFGQTRETPSSGRFGTSAEPRITFTTQFRSKTPVQVVQDISKAIVPDPAALLKVGEWLVERIRTRTLSGVSVDGNQFAAYSPSYAKEKGSSQVTLYSAARSRRQGSLFEHSARHMLDSLSAHVLFPGADGLTLEVGLSDPVTARRGRLMQEGWQPRGHVGKHYKKGKMKGKFRRRPPRVPPRSWLGASPEDKLKMREIMEQSISERVQAAIAS